MTEEEQKRWRELPGELMRAADSAAWVAGVLSHASNQLEGMLRELRRLQERVEVLEQATQPTPEPDSEPGFMEWDLAEGDSRG